MSTSNTARTTGTVGFLGVGTMGREMALNLARAGHRVTAYDVRHEAAEALVASGIRAARTIAEASAGADVVVTMLPDTPDVEAVVYGPNGLLAHPPEGRLVIDMSTIAPAAVRRMHGDFAQAGVAFIDAPVSGGPIGAKNATLSIMVGGDAAAFHQAEPFLLGMGTTLTHVGDIGAGQTAKLCNQLICGINIQAICEAFALGRAAGVDLQSLRRVLLGGSAASWMLDKLGPQMIDGDASAGFRIDLMLKDLRLVAQQAQESNVPLPGTALVTTQYLDARAHGEGGNGNQALFRVYDRMSHQVRAESDVMTLDFDSVLSRWPMFADGALLTLQLASCATAIGFVIGTFSAIARHGRIGWLQRAAGTYVEVIRNTPLLVQIFLVYFGLASVGLKLPVVTVALAALTINVGAYVTEIMRAGFDSIHKGQLEAAECLALSRRQVIWHIVLLPAMERVYPALTSQFVLLMLASSVCSQISAEELTAVANFVQSDTYRPFETYILVAVFYLGLSLLMRAGFWGLGLALFPRRRRLGTAL